MSHQEKKEFQDKFEELIKVPEGTYKIGSFWNPFERHGEIEVRIYSHKVYFVFRSKRLFSNWRTCIEVDFNGKLIQYSDSSILNGRILWPSAPYLFGHQSGGPFRYSAIVEARWLQKVLLQYATGLSFSDWSQMNADEERIRASEFGLDLEVGFDFDDYLERRYFEYVVLKDVTKRP